MATYGPGSRRNPKQSAVRTPPRASSAASNGSRSSTTNGTTRSPAGKSQSKGGGASVQLRSAFEGRENEFAGIACIAVGLLIGLSIYLDLAGPLGRGVETLIGWFTGVGRFVVPIALVGIGIALVRKGRSEHRVRLVLGWALASLAVLGLMHVVRGPEKMWASADAFGTAGGWFGATVGEPL